MKTKSICIIKKSERLSPSKVTKKSAKLLIMNLSDQTLYPTLLGSKKGEKLSPGEKRLETTFIGTTWKIIGSDNEELQWFIVNNRRFGYRISCEGSKPFQSPVTSKIANIRYKGWKAR